MVFPGVSFILYKCHRKVKGPGQSLIQSDGAQDVPDYFGHLLCSPEWKGSNQPGAKRGATPASCSWSSSRLRRDIFRCNTSILSTEMFRCFILFQWFVQLDGDILS